MIMTVEKKSLNRFRFRVAAFVYFSLALLMAFALAYLGKDVSGFGVVVGTLSVPIGALLVTDLVTTPKVAQ